MLLFFNAADRRLFFCYILSLFAFFCAKLCLPSFFTFPPVSLGVMIDAQPYVDNNASACISRGLVCICPDVQHFGGTT